MTLTTADRTRLAPSAATLDWAAEARRALQQRSMGRGLSATGDRTSAQFGASRKVVFGVAGAAEHQNRLLRRSANP